MTLIRHLIGGVEVDSSDQRCFADVDPWTRQPGAEVAEAGRAEVDTALAAARRAFDEGPWPRMAFAERGRILHQLADLVEAHSEELAVADTTDMGKPITDMRTKDVPRSAYNFRFFADHARLQEAERFPMDSGHHAYSGYDPAGVVVAISPWNFPLMLATWKVAPALAWGNTVVLKPAEDSPASASILGKLALEAGVPPGVLNVVHGFGPDAAGQWLTEDPRVDRVTLTGESATGRSILRNVADNLTPVSLELGGKGANVVFADADLDEALDWSVKAAFSNAGQVCLAGSRLYVERPIYEEFLARFVEAAESLRIGNPLDTATEVGPMASLAQYEKVCGFLEKAPDEGGKVLTGGPLGDGTWVIRPSIVVGAPDEASICRDEIFGPVVVVAPFDAEDEAVRRANATRYGLNAMIFTENLSRAHRVAETLRAGTVWVNCFFVRDLRAPFGGMGASGLGREGGVHSREFFTEPKTVVMDVSEPASFQPRTPALPGMGVEPAKKFA